LAYKHVWRLTGNPGNDAHATTTAFCSS